VQSFREEPVTNVHLSDIRVDPQADETVATFLTLSMENPTTNARTIVVDFIINTPDRLGVVRQRGVTESNLAQVTATGRIEPGSQRSMRVGLEVLDDSIVGGSVPINVTVRYYPADQPEDVKYVQDLQKSNERIIVSKPGILNETMAWLDSVLEGLL